MARLEWPETRRRDQTRPLSYAKILVRCILMIPGDVLYDLVVLRATVFFFLPCCWLVTNRTIHAPEFSFSFAVRDRCPFREDSFETGTSNRPGARLKRQLATRPAASVTISMNLFRDSEILRPGYPLLKSSVATILRTGGSSGTRGTTMLNAKQELEDATRILFDAIFLLDF